MLKIQQVSKYFIIFIFAIIVHSQLGSAIAVGNIGGGGSIQVIENNITVNDTVWTSNSTAIYPIDNEKRVTINDTLIIQNRTTFKIGEGFGAGFGIIDQIGFQVPQGHLPIFMFGKENAMSDGSIVMGIQAEGTPISQDSVSGNSNFLAMYYDVNNDWYGFSQGTSGNARTKIMFYGANGSNNLFYNPSEDAWVIGDTNGSTANYQLELTENMNVNGSYCIDEVCINDWSQVNTSEGNITGYSLPNYIPFFNSTSDIRQSVMYYDANNSRVGIATATPSERLSIFGNISIDTDGISEFKIGTRDVFGFLKTFNFYGSNNNNYFVFGGNNTDGSNSNILAFMGKGDASQNLAISTAEVIFMGWDSAEQEFGIEIGSTGAGVYRNLVIGTQSGSSNHLYLNEGQNAWIIGSSKNGTHAFNVDDDINVNGSYCIDGVCINDWAQVNSSSSQYWQQNTTYLEPINSSLDIRTSNYYSDGINNLTLIGDNAFNQTTGKNSVCIGDNCGTLADMNFSHVIGSAGAYEGNLVNANGFGRLVFYQANVSSVTCMGRQCATQSNIQNSAGLGLEIFQGASGNFNFGFGYRTMKNIKGNNNMALGQNVLDNLEVNNTFAVQIDNANSSVMLMDGNFKTASLTIGNNLTANGTLTTKKYFRIEPRSSAPSGSLGDMYVDSDTNTLCFYNSTAWETIGGSGTCV